MNPDLSTLGGATGVTPDPQGVIAIRSDSANDERIALQLATSGWCVTPDFLSPPLVAELRSGARQLADAGGFRPAGVGRGAALQIRPEIRTDQVRWIDAHACSAAQACYLARLEDLRLAINRVLFLGLFDLECHLALYPPGSRYRRHLDRFKGVESRVLSCIVYLNEDWRDADGGALMLYTDAEDPHRGECILPLGGQLVTFFSARFLHEVLPASRDRLSLTGWFRTRT